MKKILLALVFALVLALPVMAADEPMAVEEAFNKIRLVALKEHITDSVQF